MGDVNYTGDAEPISDESLCEIMRDINKYYDVSSCDFESLYVRMKDAERQRDEALEALRCAGQQCETTVYNITQREHDEAVVRSFQSVADFCARSALENSKATLADANPNSPSRLLSLRQAGAEAGLRLPDEMTPAIEDALSIMLWTSGTLARAYRAAGFTIATKAEKEQAFVLWRTLRHAIQHGDDWRAAAQDELNKLRALVPSREVDDA